LVRDEQLHGVVAELLGNRWSPEQGEAMKAARFTANIRHGGLSQVPVGVTKNLNGPREQ
jgi:hypothetical protein